MDLESLEPQPEEIRSMEAHRHEHKCRGCGDPIECFHADCEETNMLCALCQFEDEVKSEMKGV